MMAVIRTIQVVMSDTPALTDAHLDQLAPRQKRTKSKPTDAYPGHLVPRQKMTKSKTSRSEKAPIALWMAHLVPDLFGCCLWG